MTQQVLWGKKNQSSTAIYLNAGIGEPCAGQVMAMPLSLLSLKVEDSSLDENFGLDDPMGSKHGKILKHLSLGLKLPE